MSEAGCAMNWAELQAVFAWSGQRRQQTSLDSIRYLGSIFYGVGLNTIIFFV